MMVSDSVTNKVYTDVGGFVGLAPGQGPLVDGGTTPSAADIFLNQIVADDGTNVTVEKFAFNYGFGSGNTSYMDIGVETTDTSKLKSGSGYETKTFAVPSDTYYWETDIKGIRFSTDIADEWGFKAAKAIFSSGT